MTPEQAINKFFQGTPYLIKGKAYPHPLPAPIAPWHCYTSDGGHSILCLIEGHITADPFQSLCPLPVKSVMRGYRMHPRGYIVALAVDYSPQTGAITDPNDDEY